MCRISLVDIIWGNGDREEEVKLCGEKNLRF